jgi:hypothetical protein
MKKEDVKNQWINRVKEFDNGNESRKIFCRNRDINLRAFNYWYARYGAKSKSSKKITDSSSKNNNSLKFKKEESLEKAEQKSTGWIEVKVDSKVVEKSLEKSAIIIKIGKAEIKVEEGFNQNLFSNIARLLGEIC